MKRVLKSIILLISCIAVSLTTSHGFATALPAGGNENTLDVSLRNDIRQSIRKGLLFIKAQQAENGSWQHYPAITALGLSSFLRADAGFSSQDDFIRDAFNYLLSVRQPDGGFYIDQNANYNSAIVLMAFKDAGDLQYQEVINGIEAFLLGIQYDENKGFTPDSLYYGGTGYGFKDRPDLSNVQWSLEALYEKNKLEIELSRDDKQKKRLQEKSRYIDRTLQFLARCQNLASVNPESYAGNDGGFMYGPGISKAGDQLSYGSMTYAGLKSMIHASLKKDDPRVQAAFQYIARNYSIEENPGLGQQGLFYYYHTMAKALQVFGQSSLTDAAGKTHDWRTELASKLIECQQADGSWINTRHTRWMEDNPVLVSCYAILALEQILKD